MTLRLIAKPVAPDRRKLAASGVNEEESEPPIRRPHLQMETRSPERVKLSEELAILNRPLEDEVEYYDEVPPSRAKPALAVVAALAALAGAGYLLAQRDRADDNATARPVHEREPASSVGTPLPASSDPAVAPAKAPESDPVPTRPPVAPVAAGPAAENGNSGSATPAKLEPEGDPSPSKATSRR